MTEEKALIKTQSGQEIEITPRDVRDYLCPNAGMQEVMLFLKTCRSMGLNPFSREIYLVKYAKDQPASIVVGVDAYLKLADAHPQYDGEEDGIILKPEKAGEKPEFRPGTFLLDEEQSRLAGGWAKVYRRDRGRPTYVDVSLKEVGRGQATWKTSPAWMVNKTALSRALRRAFPNLYGGMVSAAEAGEPEPENSAEEQQPPDEFTKPDGSPNWERFWAKLKNYGIGRDEAHALLGVDSIKDEVGRGRQLSDIYQEIIARKSGAGQIQMSLNGGRS